MPRYTMTGLDGKVYAVEGPPGLSREYVQAEILKRAPQAGLPPQEKNLLERVPIVGEALAGAADIPLSAIQGLAGTGKTLTDLFGADNRASEFLGDVTRLAGELKSAGSREDAAVAAQIQKEAEDKGVWEQVKAAAKSFALSPIETTASVAGSAVPFILGAAAAPTAAAGAAVAGGLGVLSGVGMIKGDIYDAVEEEFTKAGATPEQAAAAAEKAQEYGGENTDMQLLGGALGALAAATGFGPAVANRLAARTAAKVTAKTAARETAEKAALSGLPAGATEQVAGKAAPGFARSALSGAVSEALPEGAQAGQERYAQNLALQREGFDVDPMKGVAGQAAFEGIASLIPGAGGKVFETMPERQRAAAKAALQRATDNITATLGDEQTTPEEKDAATQQLADLYFGLDIFPTEEEALEAAKGARRREEARAQAGKDAKTTPKAAATPVDEVPEPTVRARGAKGAEETQEAGAGLDGGDRGPDVDVTGAAGPSVPDTGVTAPTQEVAEGVSPTEPVGVAGTGVPAGGTVAPEAADVGALTPKVAPVAEPTGAQVKAMVPTIEKAFDDNAFDFEVEKLNAEQKKQAARIVLQSPEVSPYDAIGSVLERGQRIRGEKVTVKKPAPTTETPSAVEEGTAPEATQGEPVATATEGQGEATSAAQVEVAPEVSELQKFVDENNPGYEVRFNPELKTRPWSIGVPGGKLVARSVSASGLRKAVMKQPKVGPRETVSGVEVKRYPAVKPKAVTTPDKIFSRDAVDPDDIAGRLNEAEQEQVDLLNNEIDAARRNREISDAERAELVRMLEDTQEVISAATNRPVTTTGRNEAEQRKKYTELLKDPKLDAKTREGYRRKLEQLNLPKSDFVWSLINATQKKLGALRKEGRRLRGQQEATGKDLFAKGVKLTDAEKALKNEIRVNAAETKKQAKILLDNRRVVYDRARERMAEMKKERQTKVAELKKQYESGKLSKQAYQNLLGQLRPDKILYRGGKREVAGISLDSMRTVVQAITSRWNARVNVKMVQSIDDLPETVRQEMEKDDRLDAYGFLRGDDVYLIADNMDSLEDVAPTLFHEVLGHTGLRRAFREALDDILNDIYRTNPKVRKAVEQWQNVNGNIYASDEDPLARAVEEVLAIASEDGPIAPSKLDKLMRFMREAVRKLFGFPLAISDAEVRTILGMAHEQALAGDSNAVGSASNLYASKKKKAIKQVVTAADEMAKAQRKMEKTRADQLDPEKLQHSVADMMKTGLEAREFKYYMGLMSPKKFAERFMALRGLRLLDTNDMIEYASTLLGPDHPSIALMNETLRAVGRLNGTRTAIRTRMGVIITDLRKFTEASPRGARRLSFAIDYNNYYNFNAGAIKPGMSDLDIFKTDGVWNKYTDLLANPNLDAKKRKDYEKKRTQREGAVLGGIKAWRELGEIEGGHEMYTRLRDMHRNLYTTRRALTEQYMEELKELGASDAAVKRMVLDLEQQHNRLHDKVNAPSKDDAHEDYPEVPLGLFHREYFPKRRYGRFWLRVRRTEFGAPVLSFYESAAARDAALDGWAQELGKKKDDSTAFVIGDDVPAELSDFDTPSTSSALKRVIEAIQKTNPDSFTNEKKDQLIGDVYQLSLLASPEGTIRKQFIKSKNRLGWSADTLRVTADTIEEYATDLARLRHRNEIDRGLLELKKLTDPKGQGSVTEKKGKKGEQPELELEPADRIRMIRHFYTSMEERVSSEYKPATDSVAGAIVAGANQLAYISFLTSAATAITQITGIPLRVAPYLYARYGLVETTKALGRYMNVFKATPKLEDAAKGQAKSLRLPTMRESNIVKNSGRHKEALEAANRDYGLVSPMSTFNMRRKRTPGTSAGLKRERAWDTFYDGMTYMLDSADQLSREAAFMAAYDLEYDKLSNMDPKQRQRAAIDRAAKSVADTLGNYNSIYRPPVMKGSELAKAVFLFKYYSVITTAFFFRAGRAIARGVAAVNAPDKKAEREEAVVYTKELTGTLAAGFVFAGLTGTPLFTLGMAALQALQDATDDDEDRRERMRQNPLTADSVEAQFIYEWLPQHFGQPTVTGADGKPHSFASILLNGPASELSGWNIGSRVSLDLVGMWFRSPRDADTWAGRVNNALVENIPGASASLNVVGMGEELAKGNIIDALKLGLPAQMKSAVKAYDFATEGVRTGNDKIRVAKEDLTNGEIIGTALGYNPTQVAKTQRMVRTVMDRKKELAEQKKELLSDVKIAFRRLRNGDPGAREELNASFAEIRDYNSKIGSPIYAIEPETVFSAIESSTEDELFDIAGMGLNLEEALYAKKGDIKPQ